MVEPIDTVVCKILMDKYYYEICPLAVRHDASKDIVGPVLQYFFLRFIAYYLSFISITHFVCLSIQDFVLCHL